IITQEQEGWKQGGSEGGGSGRGNAGGGEGGGDTQHSNHQDPTQCHQQQQNHNTLHHPLEQDNTQHNRDQQHHQQQSQEGERTTNDLGETQEQGKETKVLQNGETKLDGSREETSEGAAPTRVKNQGPQGATDKAIEAILQRDRRVVEERRDGALPTELAQEAEYDIHEKLEWVERDVQALREMVETEPGLTSRLDTPFLLSASSVPESLTTTKLWPWYVPVSVDAVFGGK
ncbi:hypothetical protein Pcinc_008432, partial [Petrolisthes cinctipes]